MHRLEQTGFAARSSCLKRSVVLSVPRDHRRGIFQSPKGLFRVFGPKAPAEVLHFAGEGGFGLGTEDHHQAGHVLVLVSQRG